VELLALCFRRRDINNLEGVEMKKVFLSAAFIVSLMILTACSSAAVKLDEQGNGQSVELDTGQKLTVSLAGNPTTGYSWEVSEIDPAVVELVGEPDYKTDSKLIGSGGVYTFVFKGVAPGQSSIKLVYHRSWEEGVAPEEEYEILVNVN